ncbi:MAG: TraB/GumN family protein [Rhodospirillaceae bacterium]|nr:TraB/GumN family protein [Rhodospirillaceae bacterium]
MPCRLTARLVACTLLLGLLPTASLSAEAQTSAVAGRFAEGLLWRITPPGGGTPSHLFGTMHVTDPRVTELAELVGPLVASAATFAMEVEMTPEVQTQLAMGTLHTDGPTIDELLDADTLAALEVAAGEVGVPAFMLTRLKPWAVSLLVSLPPLEVERINAGVVPLDQLLQAEAEAHGAEVVSLETASEQIAVLDGMDVDLQIEQLRVALEDRAELDEAYESLTRLYLTEDLAGFLLWLEEQTAGEHEELREVFVEDLLNARNDHMVERMQPLLAEGDAVIAVGAMHLPGERGILEQLAAQGYRLERVPLDAD